MSSLSVTVQMAMGLQAANWLVPPKSPAKPEAVNVGAEGCSLPSLWRISGMFILQSCSGNLVFTMLGNADFDSVCTIFENNN